MSRLKNIFIVVFQTTASGTVNCFLFISSWLYVFVVVDGAAHILCISRPVDPNCPVRTQQLNDRRQSNLLIRNASRRSWQLNQWYFDIHTPGWSKGTFKNIWIVLDSGQIVLYIPAFMVPHLGLDIKYSSASLDTAVEHRIQICVVRAFCVEYNCVIGESFCARNTTASPCVHRLYI